MEKVLKEDQTQVYEIGYLLVSSIPEEKVDSEVATLKEVLSKKGAEFIGEEAPEMRTLAYTMIKKMGTINHRFEKAYFGWFKFELSKKDIESVKKAFEENKNMLRTLVITTIRENTYLGKKAFVANILSREDEVASAEVPAADAVAPVSVEEIDKSIDAMVKEA
jgi:ribosomal protein S6